MKKTDSLNKRNAFISLLNNKAPNPTMRAAKMTYVMGQNPTTRAANITTTTTEKAKTKQ